LHFNILISKGLNFKEKETINKQPLNIFLYNLHVILVIIITIST